MSQPSRVFTEAFSAEERLSELSLSSEIIAQIVRTGAIARRRSSALHPRNHAGFNDWSECIAEARRLLLQEGWTKEDTDGLPLIVHPSGQFAFTVATGDGATGDPALTPRTKYPKGAKTLREVAQNQQMTFGDLRPAPSKVRRDFWILLRARVGNEVHLEFSKPSTFAEVSGDRAYVTGWSERITLSTLAPSRAVPEGLLSQTTGEIDIQIDRR